MSQADYGARIERMYSIPQTRIRSRIASAGQTELRGSFWAFSTIRTIAKQVLAGAPEMQKIYNEKTGYQLAIFHLEHAVAEFRNMLGVDEAYPFA